MNGSFILSKSTKEQCGKYEDGDSNGDNDDDDTYYKALVSYQDLCPEYEIISLNIYSVSRARATLWPI